MCGVIVFIAIVRCLCPLKVYVIVLITKCDAIVSIASVKSLCSLQICHSINCKVWHHYVHCKCGIIVSIANVTSLCPLQVWHHCVHCRYAIVLIAKYYIIMFIASVTSLCLMICYWLLFLGRLTWDNLKVIMAEFSTLSWLCWGRFVEQKLVLSSSYRCDGDQSHNCHRYDFGHTFCAT